ncbi:hypothetical protein NHJ13734_004576 [Beauveria thailandica]
MCWQLPNHSEYQCGHPGTTTFSLKRCPAAKDRCDWTPCKVVLDSKDGPADPPTLISNPCQTCKESGDWLEFIDVQGRLRWRRTVGAIKPPSKKSARPLEMCNAYRIYHNYIKCGHSVRVPIHAVGPPCPAALRLLPGQNYCPVAVAAWETRVEAVEEPCPSCKQGRLWFLLIDKHGRYKWSPCIPNAQRNGEYARCPEVESATRR